MSNRIFWPVLILMDILIGVVGYSTTPTRSRDAAVTTVIILFNLAWSIANVALVRRRENR